MKNNHPPEIRFAGFTEDWKLSELSELLSGLKSGLSRMLSNQDIGLPVIRANNINNGILDIDNDIKYWYIDDPQGANTQNYLIHKNDILVNFINSEAKMGTAAIVGSEPKRPTIYTTNILNLRTNQDANPYFIYSLTMTEKYKNYIKIITKPAVNQASFTTVDFKKYEFLAPTIKEQVKIGNFFKQLDDTIALHQQELTTLKQTKQGFLQKMFPKEGESVPEVRFPGFTGDWEERKLKDLADFSKGNGYSKSDLTDEGKPVILYGRLYKKYETVIESVDTFTIEKERSVISKGNEVIVPASGETSEDISRASAVSKPGIILGGDLNIVRPSNEINPVFLALTISNGKQKKELSKRAQGKSVVHLQNSDLKEVNLLFPKKEEQIKIGNFFKQLDDTIALHQRELDALKETKKAFLQKMFV